LAEVDREEAEEMQEAELNVTSLADRLEKVTLAKKEQANSLALSKKGYGTGTGTYLPRVADLVQFWPDPANQNFIKLDPDPA